MSIPARLLSLLLLATTSCAFHTTAREWHGRRDPAGEPLWYTATTKVGLNLFVVLPLFGDTDVDGMIDELTWEIASHGGDGVRIVQGDTENYWYGFPPVTWIFTPVVSNVHAEWQPHPVLLARWASNCHAERRRERGLGGLD